MFESWFSLFGLSVRLEISTSQREGEDKMMKDRQICE